MIDGTKAYVHAVIDNYSRKILAWKVAGRLEPGNTVAVLRQAACEVVGSEVSTTLLTDGGRENFNNAVDDLVEAEELQRVLAMTDVAFSNSMIESWWRALKHQWLYLNTLDSTGAVNKLVGFYVAEHNTRIPHSAFNGATPDEVYFGTGANIAEELRHARSGALKERLNTNRRESCAACA